MSRPGLWRRTFLFGCTYHYHTPHRNDENARDLLGKMQQVLARCQQMKERCLRWSSEPFLQEVQFLEHEGGATQILLKHPTYNRFYRLYLQFQQHL